MERVSVKEKLAQMKEKVSVPKELEPKELKVGIVYKNQRVCIFCNLFSITYIRKM